MQLDLLLTINIVDFIQYQEVSSFLFKYLLMKNKFKELLKEFDAWVPWFLHFVSQTEMLGFLRKGIFVLIKVHYQVYESYLQLSSKPFNH